MSKANNNMGLAIAMGAGIGLVLGPAMFDNAGIGLVLGAGVGIAWASANKQGKNKAKCKQKSQ